jgi:hypothetical protein
VHPVCRTPQMMLSLFRVVTWEPIGHLQGNRENFKKTWLLEQMVISMGLERT